MHPMLQQSCYHMVSRKYKIIHLKLFYMGIKKKKILLRNKSSYRIPNKNPNVSRKSVIQMQCSIQIKEITEMMIHIYS